MEKENKKTQKVIYLIFFGILGWVIFGGVGYWLGFKNHARRVGIVSDQFFTNYEIELINDRVTDKYSSFLPEEKAKFIIKLCNDFGVDPDLAISILQQENPSLKEDAISKFNQDGTVDLGLWQLNSKAVVDFERRWWRAREFKEEFNAKNWKHNTYIAIQLINDLTKTFGKFGIKAVATAYNAGTPRTYNLYFNETDNIPTYTKEVYVPSVLINYNNWKSIPG